MMQTFIYDGTPNFAYPCTLDASRYTGKERDSESGNDYFGARYYGSSMGRMLSPDPVGGSLANPQTLNKYAYVMNNPLRYTDPTGLYACADDAAGAKEHSTSDNDKRFEASRQHDLQSKNADVRRGAAALGDPGKEVVDARGDKVTVQFKDLGNAGEGGVTHSVLDANGATPISNSTVTVNSNDRGTAMDADVGHEGSHVADAQDMAASITFTTTTFHVGQDISQYASEQRAYRVTDAIYRSANEPYNGCGNANCALGAGSSPIGIPGRIDSILLAHPDIYHGPDGRPLTAQTPGGNLLNVVVPHWGAMDMKGRAKLLWLVSLLLGMSVKVCVAAPTPDKVPLCDLQRTAKQGEHRPVQVSGIYSVGFEMGVLTDASCPSQSTWVELDLESTTNKEQLRSMLDTAGKADVVFVGEFYGPGVPSPNLPEAVRKSYQPGWGHLGAFKTKLVVHAIQSVKPVPADHPGSADLGGQLPILQEAALPVYPPIGRAARITGKVVVEVTISNGKVTATGVKSGPRLLAGGTVANLQTWRFASDVDGKFTVTYTYVMSDEETDSPTNPTVEMLPSLDVKITAHPVKPIPMYSAQGVPATDTTMHEAGHAQAAVQP